MQAGSYLMDDDSEALRLDVKTDSKAVEAQAVWAGVRPGMRVADLGCGSGKTSVILHDLAQPGGSVVGVDFAKNRIDYATEHYGRQGIEFICDDIRNLDHEVGAFDLIWVRFVLEYYRSDSRQIVEKISTLLKPGGSLCLIDLDHNCLNHYGIATRLERTIVKIMSELQGKANFDPYVGRKLYSFLYDLGYEDIEVEVGAHHIIYGDLKKSDDFNWMKKVEVAPKKIGFKFDEYDGGYQEFVDEFKSFFSDKKRFTYTPIISCKGTKPLANGSKVKVIRPFKP